MKGDVCLGMPDGFKGFSADQYAECVGYLKARAVGRKAVPMVGWLDTFFYLCRYIEHVCKLSECGIDDAGKVLQRHQWLFSCYGHPEWLSNPRVKRGLIKCIKDGDQRTFDLALQLNRTPLLISWEEFLIIRYYHSAPEGPLVWKNDGTWPPFSEWPDQAIADLLNVTLDKLRKLRQRLCITKPPQGPTLFRDFQVMEIQGQKRVRFRRVDK